MAQAQQKKELESRPETQSEHEVQLRSLEEIEDYAFKAADRYNDGKMLVLIDESENRAEKVGTYLAKYLAGRIDKNVKLLDFSTTKDAIGLTLALRNTVAQLMNKPEIKRPKKGKLFQDESAYQTFAGLDLAREAVSLSHQAKELPPLVMHGIKPQIAILFSRWRDELWALRAPMIVVAPFRDKNNYLRTYSDSFFFSGGLHRLQDSAKIKRD